jgi:hypothetical protein
MLKIILDLLPHVKQSDGKLIAIAKGKNKYPENFKELKKYFRKWQ